VTRRARRQLAGSPKRKGAADYFPAGRPATAHGQGFTGGLPYREPARRPLVRLADVAVLQPLARQVRLLSGCHDSIVLHQGLDLRAQFLDHEVERRQIGHQRPQLILPRSLDVGQHGRLEEGIGPVEGDLTNGALPRQERSEVIESHLVAIRLEHPPQVVVVAGP